MAPALKLLALMFGTTSTAAAGSYGLVSYFKNPQKISIDREKQKPTGNDLLQINPEGSNNNSTDLLKKQENSDLPEQHERTTQESGNLGEKTKESGDQEGLKISSPDSKHKEQVPVGVEERGKSEITSIPIQVRSLVTSNTGSRDQRWEHYISRSELQEKLEPFFGDDEDSHSDLFVAEFIKWQKEKGGLALCQKLIRDALGNVKKIEAEKCSNLSIWNWWESNVNGQQNKNLSALLFADQEKITTSLKSFGIYDQELLVNKRTSWNLESLTCMKEDDISLSENDRFLISCHSY